MHFGICKITFTSSTFSRALATKNEGQERVIVGVKSGKKNLMKEIEEGRSNNGIEAMSVDSHGYEWGREGRRWSLVVGVLRVGGDICRTSRAPPSLFPPSPSPSPAQLYAPVLFSLLPRGKGGTTNSTMTLRFLPPSLSALSPPLVPDSTVCPSLPRPPTLSLSIPSSTSIIIPLSVPYCLSFIPLLNHCRLGSASLYSLN